MKKVDYYDQDYDFSEYEKELISSGRILSLPSIGPVQEILLKRPQQRTEETEELSCQGNTWNSFFNLHLSGQMYKPRRYIVNEFRKYFEDSKDQSILEVGSGYGCTMFPILESFPTYNYRATDISHNALNILQTNPKFSNFPQIQTSQWDILRPFPFLADSSFHSPDLIISVFTLSALPAEDHLQCFDNFKSVLRASPETSGSGRLKYILFRDYGLYDMTMFKHTIRLDEYLYQRIDGTLCYYFSLEYLRELIASIEGMHVVELSYATVINYNHKTKEKMYRVFVHGVFACEV